MFLGLLATACDSSTDGAEDPSFVNVPMPPVVLEQGKAVQLTAPAEVTARGSVSWSTNAPSVATVSATGLVTAVGAGQANIVAKAKSMRAITAVTVEAVATPPTVTSIAVTPAAAEVQVGSSTQLTATARDQHGTTMIDVSFTWVSSNAAIATVSASGVVSAVASGSAEITASANGVSGRSTVTVPVVAPVLTTIELTPSSASLLAGASKQFSAAAKDQNGNVMSGVAFTWASANPAIATVSSSGQVWGVGAGEVAISASSGGKTAAALVTVTLPPPVLTSVTLNPASVAVDVGTTAQLSASAKDQYGNTMSGATFTWASANPAVATVSASGLVTGVAAGAASITATSGGKSGSATATVALPPAVATTVTLTPATLSLTTGGTAQLTAAVKDQYGNTMSGAPTTWASSNPAVATVSTSGLVSAIAAGSATITASSGGKSGSTAVTVAQPPAVLTTITLTPATLSLTTGGTGQLAAVAKDQNGSTMSGVIYTWSSSNPAVASVNASGLVTAVAPGSATISASSGGKSGTAVASVAAPPAVLTTITVTPATFSVTAGATAQLSAVAKDQNGATLSGVVFTWTSANPAVATVSASGLVTGVAAGSAVITGSSSGQSGTSTATVTAPAPVVTTVTLAPASATVAVGATQQLTATVKDQNGNTMTGQTVTWSSSNTSIATVSGSGLVTGVAGGSATVTANASGKTATSQITVSAPAPPPPSSSSTDGIWISQAEIMALPMSGSAWSGLKAVADGSCGIINLADQDSPANVCVMAKALVYARTGNVAYRADVVAALRTIVGSGTYVGRALALGRELGAYVIAADIIKLSTVDPALDTQFRAKLVELRTTPTSDGPSSLIRCHEREPTNWGTHCGQSRAAVAAYLRDKAELDRTAYVFRGYTGDRTAYTGFGWDADLSWQANSSTPVPINPPGAVKEGFSIDGVMPEDQRRCGSFVVPACVTNYLWTGMQGALAQAWLLHRQGYSAFEWGNQALRRAVNWAYQHGGNPAVGDDVWQVWMVNYVYGTSFPTSSPTKAGKNVGFTDWTHAKR